VNQLMERYKKLWEAILNREDIYLQRLARSQYESGAQMLDVNAGVAGGNEVEDLPWLIEAVQTEIPLPLMIDSANPEALKAALRVYRPSEPPILNSISGEEQKWKKLFPVLVEKKCKVVVLCMDDLGIRKTVGERIKVASTLFQKSSKANTLSDSIYFDLLVLSVAVETDAALVTLETIRALRSNFPNSHTIRGVSNVSMGLPGRRLINRTFLAMAIASGLDSLLIDVRDRALMSSIYASVVNLTLLYIWHIFPKSFRQERSIQRPADFGCNCQDNP
jgi:cobalamin-dependent methionine synthase I